MAADFYLQLDGIKGESADSRHAGWIECTSIDWDIHQPKSAAAQRADLAPWMTGQCLVKLMGNVNPATIN